jgi:hypothetical protein
METKQAVLPPPFPANPRKWYQINNWNPKLKWTDKNMFEFYKLEVCETYARCWLQVSQLFFLFSPSLETRVVVLISNKLKSPQRGEQKQIMLI